MKKIVIGVGIFLSGLIIFCADYFANRIIESMPYVSLISDGVPLSLISFLLMIIGGIFVLYGYLND